MAVVLWGNVNQGNTCGSEKPVENRGLITNTYNGIKNGFNSVFNGILNGVDDAIDTTAEFVNDAASGIKDVLGSVIDINS